jgi:hypothetical protein
MMPDLRAGPSLQKPMSTGPFTTLNPQNHPLDFQKTLFLNVIPSRRKNRLSIDVSALTERSTKSRWAIAFSVMSGFSAKTV